MPPLTTCSQEYWDCPEEKLRDASKAVELATSACKLSDWKDPNYLFTLASAYAAAGRYEKAVEWQGKANRLYTKDEDRQRGELMLRLYKQMALTLRTTISMRASRLRARPKRFPGLTSPLRRT